MARARMWKTLQERDDSIRRGSPVTSDQVAWRRTRPVDGIALAGLTGTGRGPSFRPMTTTLTAERQIVLPKKLCAERKLRAGDHFRIIADEDDAEVILLRRVGHASPNDLLDVLLSCPVKGFMPRLKRRKEPMRKVRL